MIKPLLLLLSLVVTCLAFADTVYQTEDQQGNVQFSDQATGEGEAVALEPISSYSAPSPSSDNVNLPSEPQRANSSEFPVASYTQLQLVRKAETPLDEEAAQTMDISHPLGNLYLQVLITPKLQPGNFLEVLLDGKVILHTPNVSGYNLPVLDPGQHTLSVRIVAEDDNILKESNQLGIQMHRAGGGGRR